MLPIRLLPKNIQKPIAFPAQWLRFTIRLKANTSSSSDSSSDENEKAKPKEKNKKVSNVETQTTSQNAVKQKLNSPPPVKQMDFAIKQKQNRKKQNRKGQSYGAQLNAAAENVATKIGGNTQKVKNDLLNKLRATSEESSSIDLKNLLMSAKHKQKQQSKPNDMDKKIKILRSAASQRKKYTADGNERSVMSQLMENKSFHVKPDVKEDDMAWNNVVLFQDSISETPVEGLPQLETWNELQKKELKSMVTRYPMNPFQELIQWTEEGKIWKFPIDNEQGMEQEHSVHFSEHVFLDQYLEGWCPTKGPVRHFMHLVCVGLSKNPYMTVEEKLGHINWYKDYFNENSTILKEVGALETAG